MTKGLFSLELQRNITLSNEQFIITWNKWEYYNKLLTLITKSNTFKTFGTREFRKFVARNSKQIFI